MDPITSVARCTFRDSTIAIYVGVHSTFQQLCNELREFFVEADLRTCVIKYSLNGGAKCNLCSDRDMHMMFVTQTVAKADFIDIEVAELQNNVIPPTNQVQSDMGMEIYDPIDNVNPALFSHNEPNNIVSMTDVWKTYITRVKQVFYGGAKEFRQQLIKYTIAVGFKIKFIKNDKTRVTTVYAKRDATSCPWRIHASVCKMNGNFYVRTFNNVHNCGGNITATGSAMVTSRLMALIMTNMICENPLYRPTEIIHEMKTNYELDMPYWNAWYGRELARKGLHGDDDDSYQQLVVYLFSVLDTNPGSHCRIEFDRESTRFTRCFVSFGACITGFKFCRPYLCLDGTHLKSKHKGTLLAATAKNGDQGLYPLVFAIVDNESDDSWNWFVEHLHHILQTDDRKNTFMSDCNTGLINDIGEWFPEHPHAFCYYHLINNIEAKFPGSNNREIRGTVLRLFTSCAYTFSKKRFHQKLDELKKEGGDVIRSFISGIPYENWANSYFPGERYGEMCSNMVESSNSMLLNERKLPITQLVDGICARIMRFIGDRGHEATKWNSVLCPEFEKLLSSHVKAGEYWIVNRSNENVYEVLVNYTCKVDLSERTCTCNKWKFIGFPCVHAVTVMKFLDVDPYQYVDYYLKVDTFRECYSHNILPIIQNAYDLSDEDDVPLLLPPKTKNQPGRPRSKRFKSSGEVGRIKCGRCGQIGGHNRRTCSENI